MRHAGARRDRAERILQASFLIADLTGNDLEVFYDLSVAHTFGKRVFLVTDTLDVLPYDLASNRTWVIDSSSENRENQQAMAQFLSVPLAVGPVRLFLGKHTYQARVSIQITRPVLCFTSLYICAVPPGPSPPPPFQRQTKRTFSTPHASVVYSSQRSQRS